MFSKKSGFGTKPKHTTEPGTTNTTKQKIEIMGELRGMSYEIFKYISKIKLLNKDTLQKPNQNQQLLKQIFNYELYKIEKDFIIVPGTFATYEVNIDSLGILKELRQMNKEDFKNENKKILDKIEEIKTLNNKILDNWDEAPYQQLLKKMFNEQLNEIEKHFGLKAGTFATYDVNTNSPPKSGGKSRRRRAKSSKRTKRSKARKSGKKSSKRSTRKTRRSRRKH